MSLPPFRKNRTADEHSLEAWLVSEDAAKQELAAETFFEMGPERTYAYLLALSRREEKARGKRMLLGLCAVLLLMCLASVFLGLMNGHHFSAPLFLMMNPLIALIGRPSKLHRKINALIAEQTDVSALPVIVKAWMQGGFADGNVPARSLTRLLPKLAGGDIALLDKAQWAFVLNWLSPRASKLIRPEVHGDLIRAILLTCGNLGITDALPRVKKLADAHVKAPEIQQLQQTARNYVTLLENTTNTPQMVVRR